MTSRLRVALVCIGIGRFQRGFERYFCDLYQALPDTLDLTLFVGADGDGERRRVPPGLGWITRLAHRLPVGRVDTEYRQYKQDCLAYGLALLPALLRERFDVVHLIDPPLAKVIERLGRLAKLSSVLLFTNGSAWPPSICPRHAHIHHVQEGSYRHALAVGDPVERNTLIPCGVDSGRFEVSESRETLRQRHGVAQDMFVILVVAAVKRAHKRVDHVVMEVAGLEGDVLLWIDGKPEDPDVVALAQERLGGRCRISYVASDKVGELYALADVLVHAALEESFGLTVAEAMSRGLPVLTHDTPHFEWLTGSRSSLVDMSRPGPLRDRLVALAALGGRAQARQEAREHAPLVRQRFDWSRLRNEHVDLYLRLAGSVDTRVA